MNGFFLLLPFLAVRFGLLGGLNKNAIRRAGYFAPLQGNEKIAYYIYQISNIGMFIYLIFLKVTADFSLQFYTGIICYFLGLILCAVSIVNFSAPDDCGMNVNGIYRFSRNPMYIAYFICFATVSDTFIKAATEKIFFRREACTGAPAGAYNERKGGGGACAFIL